MGARIPSRTSRRTFVTVDEGVIPFREAAVQSVLADVGRYSEWWPAGLRFTAAPAGASDGGARLQVSAGPLRSRLTIQRVAAEAIEGTLSDGAFEGEVRWTLRPVTEGTAAVLRLEIDPVPWWLRLALRTLDLHRRQSRRMKAVFEALRNRLAALGEERVPEPTSHPQSLPSPPRST
jgi:Polyketide cyclase / dehydrase and lipid transport